MILFIYLYVLSNHFVGVVCCPFFIIHGKTIHFCSFVRTNKPKRKTVSIMKRRKKVARLLSFRRERIAAFQRVHCWHTNYLMQIPKFIAQIRLRSNEFQYTSTIAVERWEIDFGRWHKACNRFYSLFFLLHRFLRQNSLFMFSTDCLFLFNFPAIHQHQTNVKDK